MRKRSIVWMLIIGAAIGIGIVGIVHQLNVGKIREPLGRWTGTKWAVELFRRAASLFVAKSTNPGAY